MTGATFESTDGSTFAFTAEPSDIGTRLDALVASRVPALSRSRAAALITAGVVRVGGQAKKPGFRVSEGDLVSGEIPPPQPPSMYGPEPIPLDILYEDAHIIVVNKPAGLVVHPAPGHFSGTLVNGLLHHCPDLSGIGGERRPGIVHRLDKDTSGVLVAAKSEAAQVSLSAQFKRRSVQKTYLALAKGRFEQDSGQIELPVGRHPTLRKKMSTRSRRPRTASSCSRTCPPTRLTPNGRWWNGLPAQRFLKSSSGPAEHTRSGFTWPRSDIRWPGIRSTGEKSGERKNPGLKDR